MWLCWMWLLCFAFYCTSHTLACAIDALGHGSPLAIIRCHTPVASIIITSFANHLRAHAISMSSANVAILLVVVMVVTILVDIKWDAAMMMTMMMMTMMTRLLQLVF